MAFVSIDLRKPSQHIMETTPLLLKHAHKNSNVLEHTLAWHYRNIGTRPFRGGDQFTQGVIPIVGCACQGLIGICALAQRQCFHEVFLSLAAFMYWFLILAWFSAIPADFFIKRVWLALPFFTGTIAFPALFITPGPALVHLPLGWLSRKRALNCSFSFIAC